MDNTTTKMPTILDLWREIILDVSFQKAASAILRRLDLPSPATLLIRSYNVANNQIETIGLSTSPQAKRELARKTPFSSYQADKLIRASRESTIIEERAATIQIAWPGLLPSELNGDVLVAPLTNSGALIGALAVETENPPGFTPQGRDLFLSIVEPYALALEKYRRSRELNLLREAAEANNRSLLAKLDRQDISEAIIGLETGLKTVMERVELVSRSETPVLFLGETGSGKEVAAREIHSRSRRANGPFLRVNCGAIPPELIDSQLFGHERGSFTGAHEMRKGWFERADGGTLFLDEIGELPLAAQVRLLRILQDGTFERVGGQKQVISDVRIVAATHRDLKRMVQDGLFREDLWYRLAIFPIEIPPLRARPEDIPALATHYAVKASKRLGGPPLRPTPDDLRILVSYSWPGNVRELSAVIERAVILGNGKMLDLKRALGMQNATPSTKPLRDDTDFPSLDQAIRNHIESALQRTNGKIEGVGGTARLLGINPHTLRARMRKLGVIWQDFRE